MNRRALLGFAGALYGQAPLDLERALSGAAADSGSLFPDITRLAGNGEYSHSFLSGRYKSVDRYRRSIRSTPTQSSALSGIPPEFS